MATRTSNVGNFNTGDVLTEAHVDSLPAGWLGYLPRTADQTGITTEVDISGVFVTLTLNANRRLKITGYASGVTCSTTDTIAQFLLYDGATLLNFCRIPGIVANSSVLPAAIVQAIVTPTSGSHTYKIRMSAVIGPGSVGIVSDGTRPTFILVEDIGPA